MQLDGDVTRMPDERLPKKVLYGELREGKCAQGNKKIRYRDTLKASSNAFHILTASSEPAAQDRTKWRCVVKKEQSRAV